MTWSDTGEIALALAERFPETDPLTIRFTDLRRWVAELPGFTGDPLASSEWALEAIQMAWYGEWLEKP